MGSLRLRFERSGKGVGWGFSLPFSGGVSALRALYGFSPTRCRVMVKCEEVFLIFYS